MVGQEKRERERGRSVRFRVFWCAKPCAARSANAQQRRLPTPAPQQQPHTETLPCARSFHHPSHSLYPCRSIQTPRSSNRNCSPCVVDAVWRGQFGNSSWAYVMTLALCHRSTSTTPLTWTPTRSPQPRLRLHLELRNRSGQVDTSTRTPTTRSQARSGRNSKILMTSLRGMSPPTLRPRRR